MLTSTADSFFYLYTGKVVTSYIDRILQCYYSVLLCNSGVVVMENSACLLEGMYSCPFSLCLLRDVLLCYILNI